MTRRSWLACRRRPVVAPTRALALLAVAASWYGGRVQSRRCGRCWACRGAWVLELPARAWATAHRRNVTIAVVLIMVGPAVVFVVARWVA